MKKFNELRYATYFTIALFLYLLCNAIITQQIYHSYRNPLMGIFILLICLDIYELEINNYFEKLYKKFKKDPFI